MIWVRKRRVRERPPKVSFLLYFPVDARLDILERMVNGIKAFCAADNKIAGRFQRSAEFICYLSSCDVIKVYKYVSAEDNIKFP